MQYFYNKETGVIEFHTEEGKIYPFSYEVIADSVDLTIKQINKNFYYEVPTSSCLIELTYDEVVSGSFLEVEEVVEEEVVEEAETYEEEEELTLTDEEE